MSSIAIEMLWILLLIIANGMLAMAEIAAVSAREARLQRWADEGDPRAALKLADATITVTTLGDLGVEVMYGVIYPPQVTLVGFGKITEQPWTENSMLGIWLILTATLAADHRATDGHRGGQFLESLNR